MSCRWEYSSRGRSITLQKPPWPSLCFGHGGRLSGEFRRVELPIRRTTCQMLAIHYVINWNCKQISWAKKKIINLSELVRKKSNCRLEVVCKTEWSIYRYIVLCFSFFSSFHKLDKWPVWEYLRFDFLYIVFKILKTIQNSVIQLFKCQCPYIFLSFPAYSRMIETISFNQVSKYEFSGDIYSIRIWYWSSQLFNSCSSSNVKEINVFRSHTLNTHKLKTLAKHKNINHNNKIMFSSGSPRLKPHYPLNRNEISAHTGLFINNE